jgi:hypothetical protein
VTGAARTAGRRTTATGHHAPGRLTGPGALGVWLVVALDLAFVGLLVVSSDFPLLTVPLILVVVASLASVGAILATRLPANPVGWILWLTGFVVASSLAGSVYATESVIRFEGSLPLTVPIAVVSQMTIIPTLGLVGVYLPLLFPTGRLPSPRWRPVAWASGVSIVLATLVEITTPGTTMGGSGIANPLGVAALAPAAGVLGLAQTLLLAVPCAVAIGSVAVRFRGAGADERQQLKWFGWSGVILLVSLLVGSSSIGPLADWGWILDVGGLAFLPIAIGVAVLRYRLYAIDRIVSRTIGWLVVTAVLGGVFTVTIVGLQSLLEPLTANNTLAVAGSTLVAAALFQPVRRRVQHIVDRRFNRSRLDAEGVLALFARRVRDEVDMGRIESAILGSAEAAMRPTLSTLWLRSHR